MSQKFTELKIGLDEDLEDKIAWLVPNYKSYNILRKSVDARKRGDVHFVYSVEVFTQNETLPEEEFPLEPSQFSGSPPLIIGSGPAGLFAALRFVERGVPCKIFEKGSPTPERMKAIAKFWRYGQLNPRNNVCFGEGGAGLFSDGKLITRIKSPYISYVMDRLIKFGAPAEIRYLANPHVGSDRIRRIIPQLREYLQQKGCEIYFDTEVKALLYTHNGVEGIETEHEKKFYSQHVLLACGHSAENLFTHLQQNHVSMKGKSFALGLRVEHPQELINRIQYREQFQHPKLSAANYKLTFQDQKQQLGVYSFCMCPGGYVLSSGTEEQGVVTNGMSNYNRNSKFANAAIVVTIDHDKSFGSDIFGGLKFRQEMEQAA
ncbi:MAG: NAD(P)/FAD-dependent oxidoreductase, partial [Bdellovibrionales bacterium]|nr:NAD(P)/FAD-dependent oxidoreductase [Bdellovibrionales bacterium]